MRQIPISTEVFAAIWADRRDGEESEDEILRRIFNVTSQPLSPKSIGARIGFYDPRYGAKWDEGDEIFRVYKGTEYRARATGGTWTLLNDGKQYPSLKALSDSTVGHENAWTGWHYLDAQGKRRPVSDKREPQSIGRKQTPTLEELA